MKMNKNMSLDSKNNVRNLESGLDRAFTLVELIVVITILAILGTIAFISLQGYSRDARDSTRIADLKSIETQLELFLVRAGTLPIPDNNVKLLSSGSLIGYQGYAGQKTLNILKVNNGGLDPVDQTPYIYRTNGNMNSYQIMGFLENGNVAYIPSLLGGGLGMGIFPQANAATNFTNRFPLSKGKVLGILLEQTTNTPIQDTTSSGGIEMRTLTTAVDMYLTNTIKKSGTGSQFFGEMEFLAKSQRFDKPSTTCPTGFIPVPGNMDFGQPAFCVAKYEMTYSDADTPTSTLGGTDWNTVSYIGAKVPVSMAGKYPIADIKQPQAILSCKSMGAGYHLITNNEWMSIARDIEQQGINWSNGQVGSGYIYNGVSNGTSGCSDVNTKGIYPSLTRNWATKTGPGFGNTSCDNKRKLTLSNGEQIWDLAGNIWEHVNKANTLDGTNSASGTTSISGALPSNNWDTDGKYNKSDMNKYGSILGYGMAKGMGNLYYADGVGSNNFFRGGSAGDGSSDGVFALYLTWNAGDASGVVGFRCAR